jgi:phosphoglucosamine mutase
MSRLFGTDGVRGVANRDLTLEIALRLGEAVSHELGSRSSRPKFVIGRDTRISGHMLEAALVAGITAGGGDVLSCGVLPTPAVAFLVRHLRADGGVVVSGSHNPFHDNGIKFFGPEGLKLDDFMEARIEDSVGRAKDRVTGARLGSVEAVPGVESLYVEHALEALDGRSLKGLRVVVDCANGAAFRTSPEAFRLAGAEVTSINTEPDGTNINAGCGSMWPEAVAKQVVDSGANLGLAHDGDADRVIAIDENGNVVDGDATIAILALELREQGRLKDNIVVSTVMANLGFRLAMQREGIDLVETPVGDRYVLEAMATRGAAVGGEQSGHIVLTDYTTTGDGLITGLRLAARLASSGMKLSQLASVVDKFPQVLLNVEVEDRHAALSSDQVRAAITTAEQALGSTGRILVRPSGTEPLVRVMVEATDAVTARTVADDIAEVILSASRS